MAKKCAQCGISHEHEHRRRDIHPYYQRWLKKLSMAGRLLYLGLLMYVDDEGRGIYNDRAICKFVFPNIRVSTERLEKYLSELESEKLAERYLDGDLSLIRICNFRERQNPNRPTPSVYPASVSEQRELELSYRTLTTKPLDSTQLTSSSDEVIFVGSKLPEVARTQTDSNIMFGALCLASGQDWRKMTATAKGAVNKATKEILEVFDFDEGSIEEVVEQRAKNYVKRFNIPVTATGLAKHWEYCRGPKREVYVAPEPEPEMTEEEIRAAEIAKAEAIEKMKGLFKASALLEEE